MTIYASPILLLALLASACSPPALLNNLNKITPGGPATDRVATGVAFGALPRQKLDIYAAADRGTGPLPVVVFFYGGAWVKGERGAYGFAGRAYAGRGFVAVVPDYRLVPKVRFPAFVQDGALAVAWVREHIARYGGDPNRITVAGHSAGAYIGAMLTLDRHYLADAGAPPGTIKAAALLAGPYDFYPFTEQRGRDALGNWPRPLETQPISYARADAPPIMLGQGLADDVVQPRNARALAAKLTAAGAPVKLVEYPGKSHVDLVLGLSKPFRGSATTLDDTARFLLAHDR